MSHRIPLDRPERVAVVGAGMVGLSTAWFLQEHGADIVVYDRGDVASGSSWGNAGWLTPSIVTPLPEPSVLKYGMRAVLDPSSPVYVPASASPRLLRFLARFAGNCTQARWKRAMSTLVDVNEQALGAFEELENPELGVRTEEAAPLLAAYRDRGAREVLVEEFRHIERSGQRVRYDLIDGEEARAMEPALSRAVVAAIRIEGQRFLDPAAFVHGLAEAVTRRGVEIWTGSRVRTVDHDRRGVWVNGERFDAVVIATGARLPELARPLGVRRLVQAGRGYSFTVAVEHLPKGPVYFPAERVACTPVDGRLRLAGMMEFRSVDAPLDRRRIEAVKNAAAPLLLGADLEDRQHEWVGSRPCTADGLPLVGRTRSPRVFVAGGHGMWGITLGPVTGKLLAEQMMTGRTPPALRAFDPLR
ncbi:D-amino-acid dehydrogenase [Streptomyces sp. KO7888]|uniref:NAD(P)/FAD-dependent oxidoreductase n=1 Tax=Streptomyces sp. KO7888 TaxID=2602737 RepID=UPI0013F5AD00|nr:FAD-dependent oxidoreductase [Streptomyces sp. KO7888]NHI11900.1 D-amino-acid dehydrogenase [Streptomyces sp. KO7888]